MANLNKQLREWADKGLINEEQSAKILSYEANKPKASWFMYGMLTLGVTVVGLGVISLVAANWHQIPDGIKLGGAFLLLTLIGLFAYKNHGSEKPIVYDASILALQLMSLATIGLIAQIYHTGGKPYQAILLWSLMTFPAVLTTNFMYVPFIFAGGLLGSLMAFLEDVMTRTGEHLILLAPLMAAFLALSARFLRASEGFRKACHVWVFVGVCMGLAAVEFLGVSRYQPMAISSSLFQVFYLLSILILALTWANKNYSNLQKILLTAIICIYVMVSQLNVPSTNGKILFAFITLTQLTLIGAFFASEKARRRFNFVLILMGLRFFALFIQAIQGLAMTGFGLILSGAILIGLATVWQKHRHKIAQWAERITQ
jgi:uncharacterized membrane protein